MQQRTLVITGANSGLGSALAGRALAAGHTVIGTVRTEAAAEQFAALAPGRSHARLLDVGDHERVHAVITEVARTLGPIDVLVANAGYGHEGSLEETTMDEWRSQFDVNVFGAVAAFRAVLPGMRERRAGHLIAITSVGGLVPGATLSAYCGSKFALEGIARSLAAEVARFGVRVTAVEPGAFRTAWSGRSLRRATRSIPDYDEVVDPISAARAAFHGRQPGDPDRAGAAILSLIEAADPPTHVLLGSDAYRSVTGALDTFRSEIEQWRKLTASTDAAPAPAPRVGVSGA